MAGASSRALSCVCVCLLACPLCLATQRGLRCTADGLLGRLPQRNKDLPHCAASQGAEEHADPLLLALPFSLAQEKTLRVYSRNACPKHVQAVHEAFACWLKSRFGSKVTTSTPSKPPLPRGPQALGAAASRLATGVGSKRVRGLDYAAGGAGGDGTYSAGHGGAGGAAEDDSTSPSCLMRTKQARQ